AYSAYCPEMEKLNPKLIQEQLLRIGLTGEPVTEITSKMRDVSILPNQTSYSDAENVAFLNLGITYAAICFFCPNLSKEGFRQRDDEMTILCDISSFCFGFVTEVCRNLLGRTDDTTIIKTSYLKLIENPGIGSMWYLVLGNFFDQFFKLMESQIVESKRAAFDSLKRLIRQDAACAIICYKIQQMTIVLDAFKNNPELGMAAYYACPKHVFTEKIDNGVLHASQRYIKLYNKHLQMVQKLYHKYRK
ncbi:MAG: hypothetical protein ACMG6E_06915, partial [Candidatus Roizmanbacteria bacterium]